MNETITQNTLIVGTSLFLTISKLIPLEVAIVIGAFFVFDFITGTIRAIFKGVFSFNQLKLGLLKKVATYSLLLGFILLEVLAKLTVTHYPHFTALSTLADILPIQFAVIFCVWALCINDLLSSMCNIREIVTGEVCKERNIIYYLQIPIVRMLEKLIGVEDIKYKKNLYKKECEDEDNNICP